MQLERYGLSSPPFQHRGDAAFVPLPSRSEPLARLEQTLIDGHGIALLTSTAGLGKSTLCRELQRRLQADWLVALLQDCGCTTRRSLLQAILYELGLPYSGLAEQEARLRMFDAIRDRRPGKQGLLLIVDEAQRLNDRLLEELRSLANHSVDGQPLVRLMLCGDLVLEERLIAPALAGIQQRVVGHESLLPLSYAESARMIDERLTSAGGDGWEHVYTKAAMELLCLVSDGSPRNLEQLALRSLQIADRQREPRVSVDAVRTALTELKELPLQWNEPANLDAYSDPDSTDSEPMDIVDLRSELDDDSISVQVGDELPAPTATLAAPTACIEFGGESHSADVPFAATSVTEELDELFTRNRYEPHVLLEDPGEPGLAETAVIEFGAMPASAAAETEIVAQPAWEQETIVLRKDAVVSTPAKSEPAQPAAEGNANWIELDIDDRYAVLDASVEPAPTQPRVLEFRPTVPDSKGPPARAVRQPLDELELTILKQVGEIQHEVDSHLQSPAASAQPPLADTTGLNASLIRPTTPPEFTELPEWDVVQPEWVTQQEFTPVTAEDIADSFVDPIIAAPQHIEACGAAGGECDAAVPQEVLEIAADASAMDACTPAAALPLSVARRPDDGHRLEDPGQRPYAQLFSRLRRLRRAFTLK